MAVPSIFWAAQAAEISAPPAMAPAKTISATVKELGCTTQPSGDSADEKGPQALAYHDPSATAAHMLRAKKEDCEAERQPAG